MDFTPSYRNYQMILNDLIASGKLCDYPEAAERSEFVILRHDVEFSVERAFAMSLLETEKGICSTYFIQIANNAYNAFSQKNRDAVLDMRSRGHHIGLHYHRCGKTDHDAIMQDVKVQMDVMENLYGFPIDRFSMHRPISQTRYNDMQFAGVINAYAPTYFTFVEKISPDTVLDVKYIADSQHRWNYGCPDPQTLRECPKMQLLIHPDYWSASGLDAHDNFEDLITGHGLTFIDTLDNECKHFHPFLDEQQRKQRQQSH